jgi:catechol 2,3-dioxygenase-like lactoylglutathione lyase family enzyme
MTGRRTAGRFSGLRNSPVVMAWRRVTNLDRVQDFATGVLGWPSVGRSDYARIYDAGGVFVGYWMRDAPNGHHNSAQSAPDLSLYAPASNPASEFVLAPAGFRRQVKKFAEMNDSAQPAIKDEEGEFLSFVDDDGNYTAYYRPQLDGLPVKVSAKLNGLLTDRGGSAARRGATGVQNPLVGCNLLASDLQASLRFYKEALGLRVLCARKDEVKLDAGTLILTLRPEPVFGLLRSLRRCQRLSGDRLTFSAEDIEAAVAVLRGRGIEFPNGIEESPYGRQAYFNDPDGHALSLLSPAGELGLAGRGFVARRVARSLIAGGPPRR